MKAKAKILEKNGLSGELYFNSGDVKDIENLADRIAKSVWYTLTDNQIEDMKVLEKSSCIWCIYVTILFKELGKEWGYDMHEGCNYCPYGKHHGICSCPSTFSKLKIQAYDQKINLKEIFSNQVYIDIINKIECPKYIKYKGVKYIKMV
jgi:hypothetical protein